MSDMSNLEKTETMALNPNQEGDEENEKEKGSTTPTATAIAKETTNNDNDDNDNENPIESTPLSVPEIKVDTTEAQEDKGVKAATSIMNEKDVPKDKDEVDANVKGEDEKETPPGPPTPPKSAYMSMKTPAPPRSTTLIPSAPAPKSIPKDLPAQTPASSATPITLSNYDISEFDPYATPALSSGTRPSEKGGGVDQTPASASGPSTPSRQKQQQQQQQRTDDDTPRTPSQNQRDKGSGTGTGTREPRRTPTGTRGGGEGQAGGGGGGGGEEPVEPVFNFSGFLKDIKSKPADPIARYLKSFLTNFAKKPFTVNEQIKLIHDFLAFIGDKMLGCEPWKSQSPAEFDNAMEAMEKLVMNRLYNYTFTPQLVPSQPITTDDLERDAVFSQRVRLFGWVRERHLDVPESEAAQGFLGFAEQELLKINHYKAPRDKMICILNCCKVIFGLLRHANNGSEDTSADAFVPILIFVVLQANPDNMISNIEYINRFRTSSKLTGEAGYYLSSLAGAIQFIETMDSSALSNITQAEFEDYVSKAVADLPPSPTSLLRRNHPLHRDHDRREGAGSGGMDTSSFAPSTPGEEPARALAMLGGLDGSSTRKFFQKTGEVVSKPLSAIGKILEGMQGDGDDESEDERQGQGTGGSENRQRRRVAPEPRRRVRREETPESPSQRLSQLGISDSAPVSGTTTPQREVPIPDFTFSPAHIQSSVEASNETYEQTRRANVMTLHQMFPQLEEEIVEAVLEGCGEDLGIAIDRLLEM